MGTRVEQPGEFVPCAGRAGRCQLEGVADSLHRLPSAAEDLQVIIPCRNRALLLQAEFCITLLLSRELAGTVELTTHTFWVSSAAIRAFAGEDITASVVEPEAQSVLLNFDCTATHRS